MLMNVLRKSLHEVVIPEIKLVRAENAEIKTTLQLTNKRLDDLDAHLADQSPRIDTTNQPIDAVHADVIARIDAMHSDVITRIDATNQRIDAVHADVLARIDAINQRIDAVHSDLITRIDTTNDRLNHLDDLIARPEEHDGLAQRLTRLWSRRPRI